MDWLRRNWPDLLIGIALIAVIAGIVATLLTGGSFFPLGPTQSPGPISTPDVSSLPRAGTDDGDDLVVAAPDARGGSTAPESTATAPPAGAESGAIAVLPPTSSEAPAAAAAPSSSAPASTAADAADGASPASSPDADPSGTPSATRPSSASGTASAASSAGASSAATSPSNVPTAPYRVSVGAFSGEPNAERQAQAFRDAGFPVFLGRQGDLHLVLVGPYDTEQEAAQAVSRIRSGDFGIEPVVYRFRPDDEVTLDGGDATTPEAAPSQPAPAAEPAAEEPAPAADAGSSIEGTFLQVGAYANRESALPQIERLEALGFDVSEREESGLVKLLVGPFEGDALTSARAELEGEGIQHFPR